MPQETHRLCQHGVMLEDTFPYDNVHESGFVLQGHENNTPAVPEQLTADDQAGISNLLAVFHGSHGSGIRQSLPGKLFPNGF